jgi:hypothetical protein
VFSTFISCVDMFSPQLGSGQGFKVSRLDLLRVLAEICEVNLRDIGFQPSGRRLTYGMALGNPRHVSILRKMKIRTDLSLLPDFYYSRPAVYDFS